MSKFQWGSRSLKNLEGIHPRLRAVCDRALEITHQDMTVIEGLRTYERQKILFRKKFSKTMNSRHLTGHAVDIVPYPIAHRLSYPDYMWEQIAEAMERAAKERGVDMIWGYAAWGWDKPHHQLTWESYPVK